MAARPPQNETSEPKVIAFGIAALVARLERADINYPATGQQVCAAVNDTAIPVDSTGNTVGLATALDRLPQDEFTSRSELLDLLHPVFEEQRKQTKTSVVGRLRALLPI